MSDQTSDGAAPEVAETTEAAELDPKEQIYVLIGNLVKEKTGKRIGKTGGREIFDLVVDNVFAAATKSGSFRFNGGFGALHIREYGAGSRNLPSGQKVTFGERKKLRYEAGVVVEALIENGGSLEAAYRVRGTRATDEAAAPAAAPPAAVVPVVPASEAADMDLD